MSSFTHGEMRRAAVRATLAPSIHNTQPWRYVISRGSLELYADQSRRLRVLDPRSRQLLISCGCALFNARVALAAAGYDATVQRLPDASRPDLVARMILPDEPTGWSPIGDLDAVVEQRRTNRRRFFDNAVPDHVVSALVDAAAAEAAELFPITRPEHRLAAARLSQEAESAETADRAYRAEIRAWTTTDPHRGDGVLVTTVPHVDAAAGDDLPIRDFDSAGLGWLPVETRSSLNQCLLLLGTLEDGPIAWLRAGEALERVWLEITRRGYVASPLTQLIEVARTNELLRLELQLGMHPHVLLRVGRAPDTPPSPRRPLQELLSESP
jgi:nitroreductase